MIIILTKDEKIPAWLPADTDKVTVYTTLSDQMDIELDVERFVETAQKKTITIKTTKK